MTSVFTMFQICLAVLSFIGDFEGAAVVMDEEGEAGGRTP